MVKPPIIWNIVGTNCILIWKCVSMISVYLLNRLRRPLFANVLPVSFASWLNSVPGGGWGDAVVHCIGPAGSTCHRWDTRLDPFGR